MSNTLQWAILSKKIILFIAFSMGCGRFSEKLSFDEWMIFNKA